MTDVQRENWTACTHLSRIEGFVVLVLSEQEHVYEVDEDAGGDVRVHRAEHHPLIDHHEDQVSKQTQHEAQLRDQHQKHAADISEVSGEQERQMVTKRYFHAVFQ